MTDGARRGGDRGSPKTAVAGSESQSSGQHGEAEERGSTAGVAATGGTARKLSRAEAGRLGGLRTRELYGTGHYKSIGKQGGAKGGAATKKKYGTEHYRRIGSLRGKRSRQAEGDGAGKE